MQHSSKLFYAKPPGGAFFCPPNYVSYIGMFNLIKGKASFLYLLRKYTFPGL